MGEEGAFWVKIWTLVAAVIICIVTSITIYNISANQIMLRAVTEGKMSGIEASCMMEDSMHNDPTCVALVANRLHP